MNIERLNIMRKRMVELSRAGNPRFDMNFWYETRGSGTLAALLEHIPVVKERITCGTVACMLGHAAMIPELRKQGLKLNRSFSTPFDQRIKYNSVIDSMYAGQAFFDLTRLQSEYLFHPDHYEHHRGHEAVLEAIEHLDKVIAGRV